MYERERDTHRQSDVCMRERETHTDRLMYERERERETDRQTDVCMRERDTQTDRLMFVTCNHPLYISVSVSLSVSLCVCVSLCLWSTG